MMRTHNCGELKKGQVGGRVKLCGWANTVRDHGGVIFIDLRDRYGLTQVLFDPSDNQAAWDVAQGIRGETCIQIEGRVTARPDDMVNPKLPTGEIEVRADQITVFNRAKTPPFPLDEDAEKVDEELKLTYRYLDLRRPHMQRNLIQRHKIINTVRNFLDGENFLEIETPILTKSTPEGARDYLVPSRVNPGMFYALPQAPQQYKQLLMISGFDRYYQIAPCFRDEDARADRSPGEFYQLDIEMAFVTQEDVFAVVDRLMFRLVQEHGGGKQLQSETFPRFAFRDAMNRFGSDKPDLRFGLELVDLTAALKDSACQIFTQARKPGMAIKALRYPDGASAPRSFFDGLQEWAKSQKMKGVAYLVFEADGAKGPLAKFLSEADLASIRVQTGAAAGDVVFFAVASWRIACSALGNLRLLLAERLQLRDPNVFAFCWIVDFPMYEREEDSGHIVFSHNPFSMPQGGMAALETQDPLDILAYQYDIVCNGTELSSGAIRNHDPAIMYKAFELGGYTREEVDQHFGHMIRAFEFGAPPHGGIAPGVDRLVMLLAGEPNIREVIAFPKNQKAQDVLVGAPSPVDPAQLKELHIRIVED